MTTHLPWVPPTLLRAAVALVGSDDKWLKHGPALRVRPYNGFGYPICPFTVWRAGQVLLTGGAAWPNRPVSPLAVAAVSPHGAQVQLVGADGRRYGRSRPGQGVVVEVPLIGAETLDHQEVQVGLYTDGPSDNPPVPNWVWEPPIDALGSPLPVGDWWTGADGFHSGDLDARVTTGVADTPLPYGNDQPPGAYARAAAAAEMLQPSVDRAWGAGPDQHPATATLNYVLGTSTNVSSSVAMNLVGALAVASIDPAVARWWGFATNLKSTLRILDCLAVAAMWALPTSDTTSSERLLALAAQADPMADAVGSALRNAHPGLDSVAAKLQAAGYEIVTLWTIAPVAPPPDPPDRPDPPAVAVPADRRAWNFDGTWSAVVTLDTPTGGANGGPVCMTRRPDTAPPKPLNELLVDQKPLVDGQKWRRPLIATRAAGGGPAGFTDLSCPPEHVRWSVQYADLWGQWSNAAIAEGDPPPPAPMPAPTVTLTAAPTTGVEGTGPAIPAQVTVTAHMPGTVDPAPEAFHPPIKSLEATVAGASPADVPLKAEGGGQWSGPVLEVDKTTPGGQQTVTATVTATDSDMRTSSGTAQLVVHDPRPFETKLSSPALLFSGRRRPDGRAELDLRVDPAPPAPPGTTWRLYTSDEHAFAKQPPADPSLPPGQQPSPRPLRCVRAAAARDTFDQSESRTGLVAIPDATVTVEAARLRIRHQLPGGLRTVQLFQLVPMTADGREGSPAGSGSFAAAVPLDDTPPPPTLFAATDAQQPGQVTLKVTVTYPGPRPPSGGLPEPLAMRGAAANTGLPCRLRRSAAPPKDEASPAGAPNLPDVHQLAYDDTADPALGWRWTATITDALPTGAPAWAPLTYWAEAAWPPEPAWDPTWDQDPDMHPTAGAVAETWRAPGPMPSEWSAPSNPVHVSAPESPPRISARWSVPPATSIVVRVPEIHPAAGSWTVLAFAPGHPPLEASGRGPSLLLPIEPATPSAQWVVVVTTPDGTVGPPIPLGAPPA